MIFRRVILESPFAGDDEARERHVAYARAAMRDCLTRGEAPLASHLLYTQVLDDDAPGERELGIAARLAWVPLAFATVVYTDLGISSGMSRGINHAMHCGRVVEYRSLPGWGS